VSAFQLDLDALGNPTRVVTTRGGVSESVAYAYDEVDRVTSACYAAATCTGKSAGRIDYRYDLVGNRTSQTRTGTAGSDTTDYDYDAADQLTRQTVESGPTSMVTEYEYDLHGNQTRAGTDTFEYNLDHTLARYAPESLHQFPGLIPSHWTGYVDHPFRRLKCRSHRSRRSRRRSPSLPRGVRGRSRWGRRGASRAGGWRPRRSTSCSCRC
jgi:hypothetical protein